MLTTPILKYPIRPFDATKDYEFIFYVNGGNQILKNNLVIEDMETGTTVYNKEIETFAYRHKLVAGTLTNKKSYKVTTRTGGMEDKWSQFSEPQMFFCFSSPSIAIPTIDYDNQNRVYNQTITFEAVYSQLEDEQVQSYRFLLYNSKKDLIKTFPEQFHSGAENLKQEITGLENGELYYIQVKTESVNGLLYDTDLIWFKPFYITPRLSAVITPKNLSEQGAVKLSSNIIQIIGKLYDDTGEQITPSEIDYVDGEWLDLTRVDYDKLIFDEGFNIMQSDFVLQIWCKSLPGDEVFLTLSGKEHGKLELIKYNDRLHAFKGSKNHGIGSHFASRALDFDTTESCMIYIKQLGNLIDIDVLPC